MIPAPQFSSHLHGMLTRCHRIHTRNTPGRPKSFLAPWGESRTERGLRGDAYYTPGRPKSFLAPWGESRTERGLRGDAYYTPGRPKSFLAPWGESRAERGLRGGLN